MFAIPASAADLERTSSELRKAQQEMQEMKTDLAYQMGKRLQLENDMGSMKQELDEMKEILKLIYEDPKVLEKVQ